jgi:hypothetical protein
MFETLSLYIGLEEKKGGKVEKDDEGGPDKP